MASVASESQIFPARPLPGPRGAGAQDHAVGAEPGGFAQLLDSKPADDRESPARSKRERSDEAAAAKGNRRSNDAAHTKRAKDKAAAKDETSEPTETTAEAKTEETSGMLSKLRTTNRRKPRPNRRTLNLKAQPRMPTWPRTPPPMARPS